MRSQKLAKAVLGKKYTGVEKEWVISRKAQTA